MSTFRNPVGPQPSSVYWRRRLVVGGGLIAVIVVILLIVFAPKGEVAKPTGAASPSPSNSAVAQELETAECNPEVIAVQPVTDATQYEAGRQPLLSMTITNLGAAPCTINVGTDVQEYRITSGSDAIWNSSDCLQNPTEAVITLEPGADSAVSIPPFGWERTRSSTSTCEGERPEVSAGGATYRLSVSLGEIESADDKAFLLL